MVQLFDGPVEGSVSQNCVWRSRPCAPRVSTTLSAHETRWTHPRRLEAAQVRLPRRVVARRGAARRATGADALAEEVHRVHGRGERGLRKGGAREGAQSEGGGGDHRRCRSRGRCRKRGRRGGSGDGAEGRGATTRSRVWACTAQELLYPARGWVSRPVGRPEPRRRGTPGGCAYGPAVGLAANRPFSSSARPADASAGDPGRAQGRGASRYGRACQCGCGR